MRMCRYSFAQKENARAKNWYIDARSDVVCTYSEQERIVYLSWKPYADSICEYNESSHRDCTSFSENCTHTLTSIPGK